MNPDEPRKVLWYLQLHNSENGRSYWVFIKAALLPTTLRGFLRTIEDAVSHALFKFAELAQVCERTIYLRMVEPHKFDGRKKLVLLEAKISTENGIPEFERISWNTADVAIRTLSYNYRMRDINYIPPRPAFIQRDFSDPMRKAVEHVVSDKQYEPVRIAPRMMPDKEYAPVKNTKQYQPAGLLSRKIDGYMNVAPPQPFDGDPMDI